VDGVLFPSTVTQQAPRITKSLISQKVSPSRLKGTFLAPYNVIGRCGLGGSSIGNFNQEKREERKMKKRVTMVFLLSFLIVSLTALHVQAIPPPPACPEGCTPGYWKNHPDSWVVYSPDDVVGDVFGLWESWVNLRPELYDIAGLTLYEALGSKGGPGIEGAALIVEPEVLIGTTLRVLFSADGGKEREDMIFISGKLEGYNELLCPLD
jgi:hypothetical protein